MRRSAKLAGMGAAVIAATLFVGACTSDDGELEHENPVEVEIVFDYIAAQPAFTYAGEYQPTDPPEPADVSIISVGVQTGTGSAEWRKRFPHAAEILQKWAESDDMRERLIWTAAYDIRNKGYDG